MKVIVLGGGIIGVTTAYYLAKEGAQVRVIEKNSSVGLGASFANAGQISSGYSSPWAAPGVPWQAFKWLFQANAPFAFKFDKSFFQLRWLYSMWQNCNQRDYVTNKQRLIRLAEYSRDCFIQLRQQTKISYEDRQLGTIQLFSDKKQLEEAASDIAVLTEQGVAHQLLDAQGVAAYEPALKDNPQVIGGLRLPNDETGDCNLFIRKLTELNQQLAVNYLFDTEVTEIVTDNNNSVKYLLTKQGHELTADIYIIAAGVFSRKLLNKLNLNLPIYPLKGYSLTIPITDASKAPISTVIDETYKVAITRFDHRIRIGGMAEVVGFDDKLPQARKATLELAINKLFPASCDLTQASFWTGLRPKTPDSTPIVGASKFNNLFINAGHGTLGWTMSCGCGQLLTDIIYGKTPAIKYADLAINRYA